MELKKTIDRYRRRRKHVYTRNYHDVVGESGDFSDQTNQIL